ncbi:putative sodium-coupled neutral amino acid transporter 10 isoform X2 [Stylophora pistillata]|uniref:Putative sodium-coupled neutral amino acid transporter 10 n=1 Tax=Stylophora pistillata TaxID=50429 RepID=A0A2B4RSJ0_STYPI|nr:putative sodium-coupled neutral amino acid transporter 10 isoform X2 [Stylophora pistillata]PFX19763.1 putative sodium-coupled neutral amino acid transporter 10 [Stylophora pistillata]
MSTTPVIFNLINCIIGVSVLAMPFCFQECGILLCGVAIASSCLLTKKSCGLLLNTGQVARRRNYEGLALVTYGAPGKFAVEASIIGLLLGTLIAFNVIIGDLVPSIFQNLSGVQVSWTMRAVLMTLLAFGVGLPLSLMRNLQSLASFSSAALLFYGFFVLQAFLSALPKILEGSWLKDLNYWRPEKLLHYLPIFALAFTCQTQLFALYETLPEPSVKKMEGVVNTGINIVACVYFLVGFFGYVSFYSVGVKGDMLTNYGNTFISQIIKLGFVMSVIVSFPLMVYPLRASLHSLIFQQSGSSENLPGGANFIPQDRFTYLTLAIISSTLLLGILFPQIEFVLALTGATMGTLIAFVFPSTMFLHVVTEKTSARFVAKLVFGLGLIFFVAGTYTVLTTQEESSHHQVDIHPPGIDPIKPVDFHNPPQSNTNDSVLHVSVREAPVDVDIAKIGLGQDKNVGKDEKSLNDAKPAEKPIVATVNEGLMEAENVVRPADGEVKRQEPPVPHAPQDIPLEKKDNEEPLKNEKRQLMSKEDEKSSNVDSVEEKTNNVNAGSKKAIKVSEQEIDEELKKLEQTNKVPTDASKESDSEDSAKVNHVLNEAKSSQNVQDKTLVKRELELSQNLEIKGEKRQDNMRNDDIIVLQQNGNQTNLQDKGVSNQVNQDTLESRDYSPRERVLAANHSMPLTEETPKEEDTVKIRDLKSNSRPVEKRSSPISSRSMKSFLSKQRSRRPRRS